MNKAMKGTGLLHKLQSILPRSSLLTICKFFIRPHLGYGNLIYEEAIDKSFLSRIESIQYNAALAITRTIRSSSRLVKNVIRN